jgi:squalene-hopene/tetraprenyl-beta-curcumene cyclase
MLANYNTAIAISSLAAAKEAEYKEPQNKAVAFLKRLQWSDEQSPESERKAVDEKNPNFGGWGYGKKERADGSNLQIALDALHDAGLKPDDPAFQRAIKFVTRMQNLSETNDQSWAGNDGGFIYTPADGGASMAGEYTGPDGKKMLRSYGSMTYAGLKSLIYAGLTKDDQRVKAAWEWISKNWTLDENPGFREADPATAASGMYYYYHTMARCLNAYDDPTITDSKGATHDWRAELINKLASLQKPDGSWVGEKKWMEDNPVLVTAYSVIALQEAKQDLAEHPAAASPPNQH